ncbi:MAG: TrbG/VirB9 family P-type conjugative transfer protein [Rhodospirillaceae bacterium]|jgi:ComB9 competence protein|nr:TrbG/VirB9 family P-type conjugative transfer protein [Rhodospirillaceae bacterium]
MNKWIIIFLFLSFDVFAQTSDDDWVSPTPPAASKDQIEQKQRQDQGIYPPLVRPRLGGQIQEAWNDLQENQGVLLLSICNDCIYKIRVREQMTTTVVLPDGAVATSIDVGDPVSFKIAIVSPNIISIRPMAYGIDTNFTVYTKANHVYPFYVRAESTNSIFVPDILVRLKGIEPDVPKLSLGGINTNQHDSDYIKSVPFDLSKLHGWHSYKLWGDKSLRPVVIFRDQYFTYLQYNEKWAGLELPTAYVVNNGIDELVNTRVQDTTLIIERVAPLISLKNGSDFLCIQYIGDTP